MHQLNENSKTVVKQVFKRFAGLLNKGKAVNGTVEILNAHLTLDPRIPKLDYGPLRPFNEKYARLESNWYASMDLCIRGHEGIENNKTWNFCATKDGYVNSNYGYLVFAKRSPGKSQYEYALENLTPDKNGNSGRQSVIYYAGPEMQVMHNDGVHAQHDFTCTFTTQHFIRNGKLEYIVNQRSCDSIFGLTYDFHHHCRVYAALLSDLRKKGHKVKYGKIYFNFGSLHVYERHYDLIKNIVFDFNRGELV